jgi:hypothetical protein
MQFLRPSPRDYDSLRRRTGMLDERGIGLIAVLIALGIAGVALWLTITYMAADGVDLLAESGAPLDETNRTRTLADMQVIGRANEAMRADTGRYAATLAALEEGGYLERVPTTDGWGSPWTYLTGRSGTVFELVSLGADRAHGPPPPDPWIDGSYACDLTMENGQLTQAPTGR